MRKPRYSFANAGHTAGGGWWVSLRVNSEAYRNNHPNKNSHIFLFCTVPFTLTLHIDTTTEFHGDNLLATADMSCQIHKVRDISFPSVNIGSLYENEFDVLKASFSQMTREELKAHLTEYLSDQTSNVYGQSSLQWKIAAKFSHGGVIIK